MKYCEYEHFFSQKRLNRYLLACNGNKRKAMTLYRYNLRLAQELLTIVSCFEVSLRNAIDDILVPQFGNEWLKDSVSPGGMFTVPILHKTNRTITDALQKDHKELIHTQSFWRKWTLACGNICTLRCSTI